ncbi:hypothetical protein CHI08_05810 [Peribacillus simplex]|nr:hypothetical protein CHI08_05810 [Peribacillus simplex]
MLWTRLQIYRNELLTYKKRIMKSVGKLNRKIKVKEKTKKSPRLRGLSLLIQLVFFINITIHEIY